MRTSRSCCSISRRTAEQGLSGHPGFPLERLKVLARAQGTHALGVRTHVADELVDQGGPKREALEKSLDGRAVLRDPLVVVGQARAAPDLLRRDTSLETLVLPLEPPDPGERGQHGADFFRLGLSALRQKNDLVQRDLFVPDPIDHGQQAGRREGDASERPAKRDLPHLDSLADTYFFMGL